jgi:hypothetical protein
MQGRLEQKVVHDNGLVVGLRLSKGKVVMLLLTCQWRTALEGQHDRMEE